MPGPALTRGQYFHRFLTCEPGVGFAAPPGTLCKGAVVDFIKCASPQNRGAEAKHELK